jgi:NAD(P)H-hydrate epimerase
MRIPTTSDLTSLRTALSSSDVVLDAIFGFSFKPPVRPPFDEVLPLLAESKLPIVSVDIPSGWDVESGRPADVAENPSESGEEEKKKKKKVDALDPDVLISLTAPKEGVREFRGRHFLGGRFVPKSLDDKFGLNLPQYPGTDLIIELPTPPENTANRL